MNKVFVLTVFLFVLIWSIKAQTNFALLVAVDSYPESSGWTDIHASNDIDLLLPLLKKHQFPNKNIIVLKNEDATRLAIDKAFLDLYNRVGEGDFVYIHFSCHGQQMLDDNGDEPDGLDESIIPYDAKRRFQLGRYEGENHLRDDDLQTYLEKIRKKLSQSGDVFVVIDACHSGTATRESDNDDYVRGTSYVFAPEGYENPDAKTNYTYIPSHKTDGKRADITVVSACQPDEINYEYKSSKRKYYGRLTYTFCNLLKELPERLTIGDLSDRLNTRMSLLSTGRKVKQTPYFETTNNEKEFKFGK
ncbi:caspase family protein [Bacteroidales bacterium OttesenSCG-928-M11]|nr:caspase family protein [Bacteroidales bacterium OttesenSCG-928-M11]